MWQEASILQTIVWGQLAKKTEKRGIMGGQAAANVQGWTVGGLHAALLGKKWLGGSMRTTWVQLAKMMEKKKKRRRKGEEAEMTTTGDISIITTTNDKQGRTGMEANGDNREDNMTGDVRERGGMKCSYTV